MKFLMRFAIQCYNNFYLSCLARRYKTILDNALNFIEEEIEIRMESLKAEIDKFHDRSLNQIEKINNELISVLEERQFKRIKISKSTQLLNSTKVSIQMQNLFKNNPFKNILILDTQKIGRVSGFNF